jgi:hypothetical protein
MTRDDLIAISTQELGKLPADELDVIVRHFGTEDRAELAGRLADEAEEMWSGDHEAPVPEDEWPSAHLQLLLGMHRDEKREAVLAEQRRIASEAIDELTPARRALLCWRFHTTVQRRVVALVASATVRAMEEGLVKTTSYNEAVRAVIDFEIELQIDEIEDHYYNGADARRPGTMAAEQGREPRWVQGREGDEHGG